MLTAGDPAIIGNRDRRKSYYHGKYAREMASLVVLLAVIGFCILRLNG